MMLEASGLKQEVKGKKLFSIERLEIHEGDRIGLIGENGSGKTTLMQLLSGEKDVEEGSIHRYSSHGYLPQLKETDSTKSGGEITQKYIQEALQVEAGILFADEPTTNLDTAHIKWLEEKLQNWKGALVLISHDRAFLHHLCSKIWALEDGRLHIHPGSYKDYEAFKKQKMQAQERDYEKYRREKRHLEQALLQKQERAAKVTSTKNVSRSEAKITGAKPYFAKKQKKMQQVGKSIASRMEKLPKAEKPWRKKELIMSVPEAEGKQGKPAVIVEKSTAAAGARQLWESRPFVLKYGDHAALNGENGSGKTTFVRRLLKKEGIRIPAWVKIGCFHQNLENLHLHKTILENVNEYAIQSETTIRIVLARLGFQGEKVHTKAGVLSGGERVKLSFAKIFTSDINMLVLDEPTNYLDIEAMEALESLLQEYEGTVLVISHDRSFIEQVTDISIEIADGILRLKEAEAVERNAEKEEAMVLETKISEVLSRLSIEPTPELEKEFQELLKKKNS
ncbi:ribosomal protection-like ABC-F family protein [Alkalicoccus daliensis]|uniref:Macrolide transport system ATP-binding/permease protein n=1 Tax=Alkalicoccus daliensis TaxID=745820 RepID=A0A1H0HXB1_9BACI|nr:ATP-binding cassette domain-containing protein [Alkalicoccus daliensis]SDO23838.1 macrolide transport system ATP-binding/permease protein [Alkalicoccus daliensis]